MTFTPSTWLRHLRDVPLWLADLRAHKWGVVVAIVVATMIAVWRAASPRGVLHVASQRYIESLDARRKWLHQPPIGKRVAVGQLVAAMGLVAGFALLGSPTLFFAAVMVVFAPTVVLSAQVESRRARIDAQAHELALALGSALRSTSSIGDALRSTVEVTASPLKEELETILAQVHLGSTLDDALVTTSRHVGSNALDTVIAALLIGQKTGGEVPTILVRTAASLRELKRLEEFTDKTTRSAKQALGINAVVNLGLVFGLPKVMPGFLDPMLTTQRGQLYTMGLTLAFLTALYLGYRITRKSV